MKKNILVLVSALMMTSGYNLIAMAETGNTGLTGNGEFNWASTNGAVDVIKGKIDKWNDKGQLEAGGFLGLGDTSLHITSNTVIVAENGRHLTRKDLHAGQKIASIYATDKKGASLSTSSTSLSFASSGLPAAVAPR